MMRKKIINAYRQDLNEYVPTWQMLEDLGLRNNEIYALIYIWQNPEIGLTHREMAAKIQVCVRTFINVIDRLFKKGYVIKIKERTGRSARVKYVVSSSLKTLILKQLN